MSRGPLLGRHREIAILESVIASARAGRGGVVLLEGEAGAGKTRLAEEAASASGLRVVRSRAWDEPGAPPFRACREVLRALGVAWPEARPSVVADEARFEQLQAIVGAIAKAAAVEPMVLLLDDLHDEDVASLVAWKLLARQASELPLCVMAAARPVEARDDARRHALLVDIAREATVLRLGGLRVEDIDRLLRTRMDAPAADLAERLHVATAGNAFFVTAIAALMATESPTREAIPIPDSVRETMRRRLARLPAHARRVLEAAAILGRSFERGHLARLVDAPDDALGLARAEGLLTADGSRWTFVHDLVRDAIEGELTTAERARLHLAAAHALTNELPQALSARALHLSLGAPGSREAGEAALRAGEEASSRGADGDAIAILARALENVSDRALRAEILAALGEARGRDGDVSGGRACSAEAIAIGRELGDVALLARAALAFAGTTRRIGRVEPEVVRHLEEARAALGDDHRALRVAVTARLAAAAQPAEDPDVPLALARAAIAEAERIGDRALLLRVLHAARGAFRPLDDLGERTAIDRRAAELADAVDDPVLAAHAHGRLLYDALESGDEASAAIELEAFARRACTPPQRLQVELARSMFALRRGDFEASASHVARAEAIAARWDGIMEAFDETFAIHRVGAAAARRDRAALAACLAELPLPLRDTLALHAFARLGDRAALLSPFERTVSRGLDRQVSFMTRAALGSACVILGDRTRAPAIEALLAPYADRVVVWPVAASWEGPIATSLAALAALRDGPVGDARPSESPRLAFEREEETWTISLGKERIRTRETDGIRYLAYLVEQAGREVHVEELVAAIRPEAALQQAPIPALDGAAKQRYRARRRDLAEAIAEAESANDLGKVERLRHEMDLLERELSRALGLGGRDRPIGGSIERARVNVTMRIRKAIAKLGERSAAIGHHLSTCVRTGTVCVYQPPPR